MNRFPILAAVIACAPLAAAPAAWAVNLVPNPDFETYVNCPFNYGQLAEAAPWSAPTTGTSDYHNVCTSGPYAPDVPQNPLGFQNAYSGVGYAGLIPYSAAPGYREYLEAPLNTPLVAGTAYQVRFRISLADSSIYAVDRLGAYLSVGTVGPVGNDAPLPYTPQVETPAGVPLADMTNWVLVSGTFVAAGGEDHIVIGSFRDDASTQLTPVPGTWPGGSYYYIDDVSVEEALPDTDQACCLDGQCTVLTAGECQSLGGTALGPGTACDPDPCGPTSTRTRKTWGGLKTIYR